MPPRQFNDDQPYIPRQQQPPFYGYDQQMNNNYKRRRNGGRKSKRYSMNISFPSFFLFLTLTKH